MPEIPPQMNNSELLHIFASGTTIIAHEDKLVRGEREGKATVIYKHVLLLYIKQTDYLTQQKCKI